MTPQEALQIVINATGEARLSRKEHSLIVQAIEVLKNAILQKQPEQPDTKDETKVDK